MKPLNWPQATLTPRYESGWVVELERKIQDEVNWSRYEFGSYEHYFLDVNNAISHLFGNNWRRTGRPQAMPEDLLDAIREKYWRMNEEGDYTLVSPTDESDGGWMTVYLDGDASYYGDFEVLPSIYFLLRGGYLSRTTLEEMAIIAEGEEIGNEFSESFERQLNQIIALGVQDVWEAFLIPGLAAYYTETQKTYGIQFNFEREFPQDTYEGRLKKWDGPKWEDEVVE